MTTVLLFTLLTLLAYSLIRISAHDATAAHPAEGYLFGDPASPTRAEREALRASETAVAAA